MCSLRTNVTKVSKFPILIFFNNNNSNFGEIQQRVSSFFFRTYRPKVESWHTLSSLCEELQNLILARIPRGSRSEWCRTLLGPLPALYPIFTEWPSASILNSQCREAHVQYHLQPRLSTITYKPPDACRISSNVLQFWARIQFRVQFRVSP